MNRIIKIFQQVNPMNISFIKYLLIIVGFIFIQSKSEAVVIFKSYYFEIKVPINISDTTKEYYLSVPNAVCSSCEDSLLNKFIPKGIGLKEFHLQIFDKWGNLIWETTALDDMGSPTEFFDGTSINGTVLPTGAYEWVVLTAIFKNGVSWQGNRYYETDKYKKHGNITIIK